MINDDKNSDKIIKEKFEGFQANPPGHIWRNVKGTIAGGSSLFIIKEFFSSQLGAGISAATGIAIALIAYNVYTGDEEIATDIPDKNIEKVVELPGESDITSQTEINNDKTSTAFVELIEDKKSDAGASLSQESPGDDISALRSVKGAEVEIEITERSNDPINTETKIIDDQASIPNKENLAKLKATQYYEADEIISEDQKQLTKYNESFLKEVAPEIQNLSIEKIVVYNIPLQNQNTTIVTEKSISDSALFAELAPPIQLKDDYGKRSNLAFGVFYTPERIYYPGREDQRSNTFDVNGIYYFSDFLVQSGFGISIVEDMCDYNVNYNKYEIVGSYYEVDSLVFDSINNGNPTYITTLHNVYDSVNRTCESNTINKYSYLRIPLIFGYRKEFKRFSYFIKGGPVLNILVKSTEPEPYYFASDISVQHIDRQSPGRIKTYWQLYLGVGLTYQLSNRFGLLVEPTASYNLSSIYERNYMTSKRPYSLGIRTGILISF